MSTWEFWKVSTTRLAIIDDHPLFREGVIGIFRSRDDFKVVGEGMSADDALEVATAAQPDVVLLDVAIPGGGLNALRSIRKSGSCVRVVMLTASEASSDVLAAFEEGAFGYLLKGIHKSELITAVKTAHGGGIVLDPKLAVHTLGQLGAAARTADPRPDALRRLTRRETEVLAFVSRGCSNRDIGATLGLTERTVKNYMCRIVAKLRVRNRVEAVLAFRRADDV
jgi:two-component system, NarL family, nitrate/nitrite response regulator NarL